VPEKLKERIRAHRDRNDADRGFAERLLEGVERIEREFEGEQRLRLLGMVADTLERHLRIRESAVETHTALAELHANQGRLLRLLELLAPCPSSETLH
jgi:hypothetical protein